MVKSINKERRRKYKLSIKQVFKAPVKFLAGARDLYVKSMLLFDGQMGRYNVADGTVFYPNQCVTVLPRSFRAGGTSNGARFVDKESYVEQEKADSRTARRRMLRSFSVGVERIDEDKICVFGEEVMVRTRGSDVHLRTKY